MEGIPEIVPGPLEAFELASEGLEVVVNSIDELLAVEPCLELTLELVVNASPRELSVKDVLVEATRDGVDRANVLPRELSMADVLVEVNKDDEDLGERYRRPELGPHRALPVKVDGCAVDKLETPVPISSATPSEASKTSKHKAGSSRASILDLSRKY